MIHWPGESPVTMEDVLAELKKKQTIVLSQEFEMQILRRQPVRGWRGDDPALPPFWCWWHAKWEYSPHYPYIVCFECRHVYVTGDDLLAAQHRMVDMLKKSNPEAFAHVIKATDPEQITFCQECLHDF